MGRMHWAWITDRDSGSNCVGRSSTGASEEDGHLGSESVWRRELRRHIELQQNPRTDWRLEEAQLWVKLPSMGSWYPRWLLLKIRAPEYLAAAFVFACYSRSSLPLSPETPSVSHVRIRIIQLLPRQQLTLAVVRKAAEVMRLRRMKRRITSAPLRSEE